MAGALDTFKQREVQVGATAVVWQLERVQVQLGFAATLKELVHTLEHDGREGIGSQQHRSMSVLGYKRDTRPVRCSIVWDEGPCGKLGYVYVVGRRRRYRTERLKPGR